MSAAFDTLRSLEEISVETPALLDRAGVQLTVAESGTGGEIARLLNEGGARAGTVTKHRAYPTAEALAVGLRVSAAKVGAFGAVSAMVVAEAAAELIDTYEGGWGLVVMNPAGNPTETPSVTSEGPSAWQGFVALGTPSTTIIQQCPPDQIVRATFALLQEQALRRLART